MTEERQYDDSPRCGGDRGYVIALTALLLIPIMAFVGFAVDLGAWYARASSIQSASEAAALAGVTYMPNFGEAEAEALAVAARNGFDDADPDIEVIVEPVGDSQNALRVIINDNSVDQYFTSLFVDTVNVERAAIAEYVSPVEMGSPNPYAGNDPVAGNFPGYWLVTFGQNSPKGQGDRFHTAGCGGGALIGCTGSTNNEFIEDGYYFLAKVPAVPSGGAFTFQVFDPLFYDYSNSCGGGWLPNVAFPAGTLPAWYSQSYASGGGGFTGQPVGRFARGSQRQWCAGDSDGPATGRPQTTYIVREPSTDPFNPVAGDIVCAATYGSAPIIDGADGNTTANEEDDFRRLLRGTTSVAANNFNNYGPTVLVEDGGTIGDTNLTFERAWRRWVDFCRIPSGSMQTGNYVIQVRTNANPSDPGAAGGTAGQGNPRYSLRIGADAGTDDVLGSSQLNQTGVSIGAVGRLPLFVNEATTNDTEFYLARVGPEYAGEVLTLDFYDITDGGAILDLEVVPPTDSGLAEFADCEFARETDAAGIVDITNTFGGTTSSPPGVISGKTCAMGAGSGTGNGAAFLANVRIPEDYTCDDVDPAGCFLTVRIEYGSSPQDTTTWSAGIGGDPVRLTG